MNSVRKKVNLEEIDKPIRDIIKTMNELGFKTVHSCAGYNYPGHIIDRQIPVNTNIAGKNITIKTKMFPMPYVIFRGSIRKVRKFYNIISDDDWRIELDHNNKFYLYFVLAKEKNHQLNKDSWKFIREALVYLKRSNNV